MTGNWERAGTRRSEGPGRGDRRTEVHQRLGGRGRELVLGPALDALDVDVDGQHVLAEGEAAKRRGRVRADPGKRGEVVGPAELATSCAAR